MSSGDFNLELDNDELEFDEDGGLIEDSDAEGRLLDSLLGIGDLELDDEELSFEDSSSADSARRQGDISKEFIDYYQLVINAKQKIYAQPKGFLDSLSMPPMTDFSYISDYKFRQSVYSFFCEMMRELTVDPATNPAYENLTADQAFKVLVDEMFNDLHFTPNVNQGALRRTFDIYYEKNKKLAKAKAVPDKSSVAMLVDKERLEEAELVYSINSLPFNIVTQFFSDESLVNKKDEIVFADYGDFVADLKPGRSKSKAYHRDVYVGIIDFLTSSSTFSLLGLTEDQRIDFSIGELLRRYVVQELNSCTFYPTGLRELVTSTFSQQLLSQLYNSLQQAIQKQSFAAEILCLILELMLGSTAEGTKRNERIATFQQFTVGIAQYLATFTKNSAYINPVFYTYIGKQEESSNGDIYELGYVDREEYCIVGAPDILFDVVGDNSNVFHIPLVLCKDNMKSVVCPPVEVKDNLRKATIIGHLQINSTVSYRYSPRFAWLSGLSISSGSNTKEVAEIDYGIRQDNDPLLNVLLSYDNTFDSSGEYPTVVNIEAPGKFNFVGISNTQDSSVKVLILGIDGGPMHLVDEGIAVTDDSGNLIVRFIDSQTSESVVLTADAGEYNSIDSTIAEDDNATARVTYSDIFGSPDQSMVIGEQCYQRSMVKHLCDLNALDYEAELETARNIIVRDLPFVLGFGCLDQMLGSKVLECFLSIIDKQEGKLDTFNFSTLKEVWGFTYGEPNCLSDHTEMSPALAIKLRQEFVDYLHKEGTISMIVNALSNLDVHTLALQACSRSELSKSGDYRLYMALHGVPEINIKLRELEDQMVLILALTEIGSDIAPVFGKSSAISSAYSKVCTQETVLKIESDLRSSMRIKEIPPCLTLTKDILYNTLPDNCAILKYFVLEYNAYGVLTEFEECARSGCEMYKDLYATMKKDLGIEDIPEVCQISELEFHGRVTLKEAEKVFFRYRDQFINVILDGLVCEASNNVDLHIIKAYDILTAYGRYLFNLPESAMEDFTDNNEYSYEFYSYVGSFAISYSPVFGEAAGDIDGGYDRFAAYMRHRKDYVSFVNLGALEGYDLRDLRQLVSASVEELIGEDSSTLG